MQGLPLEDPKVSQALPPNPPDISPQQSEIQDNIPSQLERTDSLNSFWLLSNPIEYFHLPLGYERCFLYLNSTGEIVVDTFGLPPEIVTHLDEDPLEATDTTNSRRKLLISGTEVDIPATSEPLETSYTFTIPLDHFNTTMCYYFAGSKTFSSGPNLTTPL
jgi:hypothetical protein